MVSTPPRAAAGPAHADPRLHSRTPVLFENGGADMLLMTSNTRSGGVGQGRASFSAPRSGRSALTDSGAEGIRPPTLKGCVLLWFGLFASTER